MIKLQKADIISLVKALKLTTAAFGLGWKTAACDTINLQVSCLSLDSESKGVDLMSTVETIDTNSDDRKGFNVTVETVTVKLDQLPANVTQLLLIVNSYSDAPLEGVQDVFCRVRNALTGTDLVEYDLGAEYGGDKAIVVAKLSREDEDWKFTVVGEGFPDGIQAILNRYGLVAS